MSDNTEQTNPTQPEPKITNPEVHKQQEEMRLRTLRQLASESTGKYDPNESEEDATKDIERGYKI